MDSSLKNADIVHDLENAIAHAAHLLPAQGPINVFVHHNTLHALEELRFLEAVSEASRVFGCHPFLSEPEYRAELDAGNFGLADIEAVLIEDLQDRDDDLIATLGTRFALRFAMLQHPVHAAPVAEMEWLIAETDALRKFRSETDSVVRDRMVRMTRRWVLAAASSHYQGIESQAAAAMREIIGETRGSDPATWESSEWEACTLQLLWRAGQLGVARFSGSLGVEEPPIRHRDFLHEATGVDSDFCVNDLLVRYCAAFLDQGFSQWELPMRDRGFYQVFLELYAGTEWSPNEGLRGLGAELSRLRDNRTSPLDSISESLEILGVTSEEMDSFLAATFLTLRGWAGMIHQVETRGDRVPHGVQVGTLVEFLAVRLILERMALTNLALQTSVPSLPLSSLRSRLSYAAKHARHSEISRAFSVFQIAQIRGWTPESLFDLTQTNWASVVDEIESFGSYERRRVFQLAFERAYREKVLNAFTVHTRKYWLPKFSNGSAKASRPSFQILCCLDDREESFRRHFEEIDPQCETLGTPGFFAVPMYYRGASDAHFVPLCPIIIKPEHYVAETVHDDLQDLHGRRSRFRRVIGKQAHALHTTSRSFVGGLAMAILGPLASIPLVARVLFPRAAASMRRAAGRIIASPDATQLTLERSGGEPGKSQSQLGFTVTEMANSVERMLRDIGLTSNLSRLVVIVGHGSSSLNNPHESAYNCGACGGGRGGPNARAVAAMANEPRVRALLAERGLHLPDDTVFLGAYHNTCDDSVVFAERERLPATHLPDLEHVTQVIDQARERNAHERCRRFASASLSLSSAGALRHVEERSEDLSQTRPEYNHATNAICTVGRRSRTRGLYLDRRSFLVSYDPRQDDDEQSILTRILSAVVPVCGGINLEYYFSRVDVAGYGCGSKLPHNVTSLVGVMDGAASDLRTGLSAQMVEIHDPVRLLFVVETNPEAFLRIMDRVPVIRRLCGNGWVQVATLSPESDEIFLLKEDRFERFQSTLEELPTVANSVEWYRGWRTNLDFAHVLRGLSPQATTR